MENEIPANSEPVAAEEYFPLDTMNISLLNDAPTDVPSEEPTTQSPTPAAADPDDPEGKRFTYWQSKHDKLRRQLDEVQWMLPIVEALKSRPDVIAQLSQPTAPAVAPETTPALTQPTPPKQPRHYDQAEAYTNPESDSFKYRIEYEEYRDKQLEYATKKAEMTERAMQEALQAAAEARQRDAFIQERRMELAAHGIVGVEADRCLQWMTNPKIEMDDLVDLWRIRSGQAPLNQQANQPAVRAKAQEAIEARKRPVVVPSLASASSGQAEVPSQMSDSQKMSQSFLAAAKQLM